MAKHSLSQVIRFVGAVALVLGGCGGDAGKTTCTFSAGVSGAVAWQSSGDPICEIPFGSTQSTSVFFRPLDGDVELFTLVMTGLKEGQTGDVPASVKVELRDSRKWATASAGCTAHVTEQAFLQMDEFGKQYQLTGTGECAAAAMPSTGASGTLTVAPFSFYFPARF